MKNETIKILRDPKSFEDIILNKDKVIMNSLGEIYEIEQGILKFIKESDVEGNNKKYLQLYDKIARFYNLANKIYFLFKFGGAQNYRNQFLSELEIKPNDRVIEISVGTADNFRFLPNDIELFGLDISMG